MDTIDQYVAHRSNRMEYAPSTAAKVRATLEQWHRHAGPPRTWTADQVLAWVHDPAVRPNTRKMRLGRLRPYMAWLVEHDLIDTDLTVDVPRVRVPQRPPRNLDRDTVTAILTACPDQRAVVIVMLMVHCGLRCVDVARARVEDLDQQRRTLDVRAKGGRGDVTHTVPVPAECWAELVTYVRSLGRGSGPLVANQRRIAPTPVSAEALSKLVRSWIAAAGVKGWAWDGVSAHALRHTCAQDMLDQGASVRDVQHALGHTTSATTERFYLLHQPRRLADAMDGRRYLAAA